MEFLAFPLNIILLLLWGTVLYLLWRSRKNSRIIRFLLSPAATYSSIGLFLVICLVIGMTGRRELTGTWPFAIFMLFFQTVLALVVLRGWKRGDGRIRWRFLLLHVGLLTAVGFAYWGAPDSRTMRVQVYEGVPVSEAYTMEGKTVWLDYSLTLEDFTVSYGDDGQPSDYRAYVKVDDEAIELRVNHPYSIRRGEDLYLSGYDLADKRYCILQIVHEPWRYGALAGILMMLAGAMLLFIGGPKK